jgi:hypothetical protein
MDKLITSSPTTLKWLGVIKSKVAREMPSLIYKDSKYWTSFKNPETERNFVFLQPQKNQIRLFTKLNTSFDNSLQITPSTSQWAETYPSIFLIQTEKLIDKAVKFIIDSYKRDLKI